MAECKHQMPPFRWEAMTPASIKALCDEVCARTRAVWDGIAALEGAPATELTFEKCVAPLMNPPHCKTNAQVCSSKFLQHCSTDEAVRAAAKEAGVTFSKLRVEGYAPCTLSTRSPRKQTLDSVALARFSLFRLFLSSFSSLTLVFPPY